MLPTIREILSLSESTLKDFSHLTVEGTEVERVRTEREWWVAIATLEQLLLQKN
jgi:hypothetical protein